MLKVAAERRNPLVSRKLLFLEKVLAILGATHNNGEARRTRPGANLRRSTSSHSFRNS
jgi:hypothetical protein